MKIKVKTSYPWANITGENCEINISDNLSSEEIKEIAFEYALDLIFNRGISWDYEIIKKDKE